MVWIFERHTIIILARHCIYRCGIITTSMGPLIVKDWNQDQQWMLHLIQPTATSMMQTSWHSRSFLKWVDVFYVYLTWYTMSNNWQPWARNEGALDWDRFVLNSKILLSFADGYSRHTTSVPMDTTLQAYNTFTDFFLQPGLHTHNKTNQWATYARAIQLVPKFMWRPPNPSTY